MNVPRLLLAALTAVLATTACARPPGAAEGAADPGSRIAFTEGTFEEALAKARGENRLLLVDVYTDWCGWCKKLDREVFGNAQVAAAARPLVAVRVNAEKGGEDVARRFGVRGYPTILFVDGTGNVVERIEGYVDAGEMLKVLSSLPRT